MKFAAMLYLAAEVIMMPFISPGVPPGTERLRCNVTAVHTKDEMGYTIEALGVIGKMLGIVPKAAKTSSSIARRLGYLFKHKAAGFRQNGFPFVRHEIKSAAEIAKRLMSPDPVNHRPWTGLTPLSLPGLTAPRRLSSRCAGRASDP